MNADPEAMAEAEARTRRLAGAPAVTADPATVAEAQAQTRTLTGTAP